ncbi:hypothetical protein [Porphyromonas cangingivalis]|uniref:hypothetical protein n=1 Tax=Porphyromonas cangingivalis TaxID=36874 RepID=UPI001F1667C7|nr:hypothetical protein [Porphyromonas cangingivalis]
MKKEIKTALALLGCSTLSAVGAVGLYDFYKTNHTSEGASHPSEHGQGTFKTVNYTAPATGDRARTTRLRRCDGAFDQRRGQHTCRDHDVKQRHGTSVYRSV